MGASEVYILPLALGKCRGCDTFETSRAVARDRATSTNFSPQFNPIALRKAKIVCNFGCFECNRVKTFRRAVMDEMS